MKEATLSQPTDQEKPESTPAEPAKSGFAIGKILLVVVIATASSAVGGGMSWFMMSKALKLDGKAAAAEPANPEQHKAEQVAKAIETGGALPLEPFVVNLADPEAAR